MRSWFSTGQQLHTAPPAEGFGEQREQPVSREHQSIPTNSKELLRADQSWRHFITRVRGVPNTTPKAGTKSRIPEARPSPAGTANLGCRTHKSQVQVSPGNREWKHGHAWFQGKPSLLLVLLFVRMERKRERRGSMQEACARKELKYIFISDKLEDDQSLLKNYNFLILLLEYQMPNRQTEDSTPLALKIRFSHFSPIGRLQNQLQPLFGYYNQNSAYF